MQLNLVRTKTQIPTLAGDIIPRSDLDMKLNGVLHRKLALISAPAGFGKTTAVASWLAQAQSTHAWLSLDEADNDLVLFVRYLVEAIHTAIPDACANALQTMQVHQALSAETVAPILLQDLEVIEEPILIVLDDYHLVHDVQIHDLVRLLVKRLPDCVHLTLVTRVDPPLPLPRLRVRNQLVELRGQDLRFSDADAEQFLLNHGQSAISQDSASRLNRQVDGWIAGLQLASLALKVEGRQDGHLVDSQLSGELLSEYLVEEVLAHLPLAVQRFLQSTSILDRFSVPLCAALLEKEGMPTIPDVEAIVDDLKRANLFVVTVDRGDGWYRYHHLFQRILRQRLANSSSRAQVEALHRRAASWHEEHGHTQEALQHALLADDLERAVALVEACCQNFLNGLERHVLERWMAMLPDELIWQRPRLLTAKAWLLYRHWRLDALDVTLCTLGGLLETQPTNMAAEEFANLRGQFHALCSATHFHVHMNFDGSINAADCAERALPASEGGALSTAILHRAFAQIGQGERERPTDELEEVIRSPAPSGPARAQAYLGLAFVHYLTGNLDQVETIVERMRLRATETGRINGASDWLHGLVALERHQLALASERSSVMYQERHRSNFLGGFYAGCALARILQLQGRLDEAQSMISDLYVDTGRLDHVRFLDELDAHRAFHWLLKGEQNAAKRWAHAYQPRARHDLLLAFDTPGLIWARILTSVGTEADRCNVQEYLSSELERIHRSQFNRRRVQLLSHLAAVSAAQGETNGAVSHTMAALSLAQPCGLVRSVADAGERLVPLLQPLLREGVAPGFIPDILAAIPDTEIPQRTMATATLLTRREQEILNLMRTGRSNQEIAETLVISLHTVKRHATNIYNKLTVDNRSEAIYRATELGILS